MSRRELENLLGNKLTDEQWEENQRIFAEQQAKIWDEEHPLED